jgi:hypothetical protein
MEDRVMYLVMILTIAAVFVLTIWLCWFALNLVLDTSRESYLENRRYIRTNLTFAMALIIFIAVMLTVMRSGDFLT